MNYCPQSLELLNNYYSIFKVEGVLILKVYILNIKPDHPNKLLYTYRGTREEEREREAGGEERRKKEAQATLRKPVVPHNLSSPENCLRGGVCLALQQHHYSPCMWSLSSRLSSEGLESWVLNSTELLNLSERFSMCCKSK